MKRTKATAKYWGELDVSLWPDTNPSRLRLLDEIMPYPDNARTHPEAELALLSHMILKYGPDQDIVLDEDGVILKGHGRRLAARMAGLRYFPVTPRLGLSDADKRAMRIQDNAVALMAGWDEQLLRLELINLKTAGYDMPMLGFNQVQLVSFMANVPAGGDPEATPEPPTKPITKLGDIWVLGKHRLLCGDSTKKEDVERVLDGDEPNLMVTDPPYGVNYDPNWRNEPEKLNLKSKTVMVKKTTAIGKVVNDDRADWTDAWKLFEGNVAYVWCGERQSISMAQQLTDVGMEPRNLIVWGKTHHVISRGHYHPQHETCWYAVRAGETANWKGDRAQTTLWTIENLRTFGRASEGNEETGHGTQKPVECMRRPIINNSVPGDLVYTSRSAAAAPRSSPAR